MKMYVLKCPECGATLEVEAKNGRDVCYCQYCGSKILLDDEHIEVTINKNIKRTERKVDEAAIIREENKEKEDKRAWKAAIVIFMAFACLVVGFILYNFISEKEGKIKAGDCDDLIGENYKTVEAHFESAGFTNIKLINLDDSGIKIWKDEDVAKISVGGDTDFCSDDWFDPDTKVVISYH